MHEQKKLHENRYRVEIGHTSVTVEGETVQEALSAARIRLCRELPRLWDVIQSLEDHCFRVMRLT
jgi:hypothetical protein